MLSTCFLQASGFCLVLLSPHADSFFKLAEAAQEIDRQLKQPGVSQVCPCILPSDPAIPRCPTQRGLPTRPFNLPALHRMPFEAALPTYLLFHCALSSYPFNLPAILLCPSNLPLQSALATCPSTLPFHPALLTHTSYPSPHLQDWYKSPQWHFTGQVSGVEVT